MIAQLEELTLLVSDLVDLAREEEPVRGARAARGSTSSSPPRSSARGATRPACAFTTDLEPALVDGVRGRLDRAVANLLDNAAKYSDGRVEVDAPRRAS